MANNKIVLSSGEVLIDLTGDTAEQGQVLAGYTFHDKTGTQKTGSCAFDVDSSNVTASVSEILAGKTAAVRGSVVTGTMTNNGGVTGSIASVAAGYTIPQGYHDGSGTVNVNPTDAAKIIPGNIKQGVTILGVDGSYTGASITAQSKQITPSFTQQVAQPDTGYDYLSSVTVEAIPVTYTDNAAGGKTVTIG